MPLPVISTHNLNNDHHFGWLSTNSHLLCSHLFLAMIHDWTAHLAHIPCPIITIPITDITNNDSVNQYPPKEIDMPLPGKPKPRCGTLTETNIAPENEWLEYACFPLRWPIFKGYVSFREVKWFSYSFVGFYGSTLAFGEPAATPAPFLKLVTIAWRRG